MAVFIGSSNCLNFLVQKFIDTLKESSQHVNMSVCISVDLLTRNDENFDENSVSDLVSPHVIQTVNYNRSSDRKQLHVPLFFQCTVSFSL